MQTHPLYGILLAALGALVITPDALFMRISGMDGAQMLGWRGLCVGTVFWTGWLLTSRDTAALRRLWSGAGLAVIGAQFLNALLFPLGIAAAPVAVVLLAVATVPVVAALLSRVVLGEPTRRATWIAIAAVLTGIAIAVSGQGELAVNRAALIGALCGIGVAACLATTFVTLRRRPDLPLLPALGTGALLTGLTGLTLTGPERMTDGNVPAILLTGLVILPASFFALTSASRHTQAANVSLFMLLETAIGPLWVWAFLDEAPTLRMLTGGAIVLGSLALYILATSRRRRPVART
ncbi:DMT family transporter [Salipiger sp.]|uniref:DMT family transporter n=1 Tax=Salipiger sp. TaxID=2078585 RepID=UPI003A973C97